MNTRTPPGGDTRLSGEVEEVCKLLEGVFSTFPIHNGKTGSFYRINGDVVSSAAALLRQLAAEREKACAYVLELTNDQVGYGPDPIGFLIASHGAVRGQRDTAQELVRAWEGAVSSLEAHIMDRAAMKDPANPETYLSILRSEVAGVQRRSEQCLASRWHAYKQHRDRIEALEARLQACEAERDRLKAAVRLWDTALTYDGQQRKYRWNTRNLDRAFEATRQALKDNDHE